MTPAFILKWRQPAKVTRLGKPAAVHGKHQRTEQSDLGEVCLLETGAELLKKILIRSSVRLEKILHPQNPKQQSVGN